MLKDIFTTEFCQSLLATRVSAGATIAEAVDELLGAVNFNPSGKDTIVVWPDLEDKSHAAIIQCAECYHTQTYRTPCER